MGASPGYPEDWKTDDLLRNWDFEPEEEKEARTGGNTLRGRAGQLGCLLGLTAAATPPAMAVLGSGTTRLIGIGGTVLEVLTVGVLARAGATSVDELNGINRSMEISKK